MVYCNNLPSKYDVETASRHIDVLTYNRINSMGWDNLTPYQKRTIEYVCERLAIFEYENKAALSSPVSSVSLSGVSVNLDLNKPTYYEENGIILYKADYDLLITTGLCSRIL